MYKMAPGSGLGTRLGGPLRRVHVQLAGLRTSLLALKISAGTPLIAQYRLALQMAGCSRQEQANELEPPQQPRTVTVNCDPTPRRYIGSPNYKFKGSASRRDRSWSNRPWINLQEESNDRTPTYSDERGCVKFTLASYNLLAQSLLEKNSDLYTHCPPALLAWEHRRQRLLDELIHYNADVYCFQEVEETAFHEWFEPELKKQDYHGVFKKRTGQQSDGCAVFFKQAVFELDKVELIEYQRNVGILTRDNIGVILLLKPKSAGETKRLCVATTHLLFNPKAGEIKLAQLCLLLAEIHRLASNYPVILCGDFNMRPLCPLYTFIERGALDYSRVSAPEVAGYYHGWAKRRVPSPLFPPNIGIGMDCTYEDDQGSGRQEDHHKHSSSNTLLKRSRLCEDDEPKRHELCADGMPKRSRLCEDYAPEMHGTQSYGNPRTMLSYGAYLEASNDYSSTRTASKPPLLTMPLPPTHAPYPAHSTPSTVPLLPLPAYDAHPARSHSLPHTSKGWHTVHPANAPEGNTYRNPPPCESRKTSARVTHSFRFKSAYPHQASQANGPSSVTTFHMKAFETVDYIFHSVAAHPSNVGHLRLLGRLALPSNRTLREVGPLPNAHVSSDHVILCTQFEFTYN